MTLTQSGSVLSDDLLERCAQRAAGYDRENRFFFEDLEELREAKYLLAAVPQEFGGLGLTLAEICREQRRLARRSAPTALAMNMHIGATGVAAELWREGDRSQVWMLEEAGRGAVFAYGHAESGNDLEVLYSSGRAERVDGGYRFLGTRISARCPRFGTGSTFTGWITPTRTIQRWCTRSCRAIHPVTASSRPGTRSACGRPQARIRFSREHLCRIGT
jgi:alkylation response protein AidB-like acyl-CoA dehydrogenase